MQYDAFRFAIAGRKCKYLVACADGRVEIVRATILEIIGKCFEFLVAREQSLNIVVSYGDLIGGEYLPERIFVIIRRAHNKIVWVVQPATRQDIAKRAEQRSIVTAVGVEN